MPKNKLVYSLALAPLLLGGYSDSDIGTTVAALSITSLPNCAGDQFLVYRKGTVNCETVIPKGAALPDCKSSGLLLNSTLIGEVTQLSCTPKGSIQLASIDQATIINLQSEITQIGTQITALATGTRVASRTFRGLTPSVTSGNMGGIKMASAACAANFGPDASMCDAYSVYISLVAGKIDVTQDIAGAWVYQAEWTNAFGSATADVTAGLGDNCAGYTSAAAAGGLAGTKFSFLVATGDATNRVPKFFSNTTCDTQLPIACCQ